MARPKGSVKGKGRAFKDPNKPKRAMSAYFFFMQAYREQCKKENKDVSKVAEFTRDASGKWREMTEDKRSKYEALSKEAKKRYEEEMKHYVPPKGMKMKRSKDPNKPKRPPTSYILFLNTFREENKDTLSHKEVMVKAGEKWRGMTAKDKEPFETQAKKEKETYDIKVSGLKNGKKVAEAAPVPPPKDESEEMDDEDEEEEEEDEESDE